MIIQKWPTRLLMAWRNIVKVLNQKVTRWPILSSCKDLCCWVLCYSEALLTGHWRIWLHLRHHFLHLYACTQSTQQWNLIITQDRWITILSVCVELRRPGESLSSIVDLVLNRCLVSDFQPILHKSTKEAYEDRLAALWQMANHTC